MSKYEDPKKKIKSTYSTNRVERHIFKWGKKKKTNQPTEFGIFYYFYLKCKCLWVFIKYYNF